MTLNLYGLVPISLPPQEASQVKAATTMDDTKIMVYLPFSLEVTLPVKADEFEWLLVDLEEKRWGVPIVESAGIHTKLRAHHHSDALIIGLRKKQP